MFYNFSADRTKGHSLKNETTDEVRERSRHRSHKVIRRLVQANYNAWINRSGEPYLSKFLTLTFRENMQDVKKANEEFTLFIKRLNYEVFKSKKAVIRYIAVIEFQPTSGRVHYHVVLFNLPYIPRYIDVFNKTWGLGYLWIEKIENERGASRYLTKYITKENDDRLRGEKSYFCSKNLKKPFLARDEKDIRRLLPSLFKQKPFSQFLYKNEHTGNTRKLCYDLSNNKDLKNCILAIK